jgi:ATP-dependent RNA helicase HelY
MAVNLIANYDEPQAMALLNASFAQFRSESRRAQLEDRAAARRKEIAEFRAAAECDRGDVWAYLERHGDTAIDHRAAIRDLVQRTDAGDVLRLGDERVRWVIVARSWGANPRLLILSTRGETRRVAADALDPSLAVLGRMDLPLPIRSRDGGYLNSVAARLREWEPPSARPEALIGGGDDDPVATCPQLGEHLEWARRYERATRELRRTRRRLERDEDGIVNQFRAVLRLLESFGYTKGWALTDRGEELRFLYNELDLLLTEAVEQGVFHRLAPAELAAVVSSFTFEARRDDGGGSWPLPELAKRGMQLDEIIRRINQAERRDGLPETRLPDPGFSSLAHAWAEGVDLEDLFDDELAAGDFVRNCRQLIDLLRQLRDAVPDLRSTAAAAIKAVDRGVVAAGGRF